MYKINCKTKQDLVLLLKLLFDFFFPFHFKARFLWGRRRMHSWQGPLIFDYRIWKCWHMWFAF